jgi:methionyl aminopeptidase
VQVGIVSTLKDDKYLYNQRIAGRCVSAILKSCELKIKNEKNINLKDFEETARLQFKAFDCIPTFLNYKGFPSLICTSVNKQMVHGTVKDYLLQPGDVVTVDLGATYNGSIADAARTWIYGEPKEKQHVEMVNVCHNSLKEAINNIKVGSKIGSIGNSIFKYVKDSGFSLITQYGGHGIGIDPHEEPFISNKDNKENGITIRNGMTFAIEPILIIGKDTSTRVSDDGWTVIGNNISCHFEDTLFIKNNSVYNLTEY